jgi:type I restriction enzyme S subunit
MSAAIDPIELVREYRTRLVTDVVTGKLDVRPAARDLPSEPLAPELESEESPESEEAKS